MKKESIFKSILNTVSKLSWMKGTALPAHKNMKPGKGFNEPVSDHAFDYLKELDDAEFDKLIKMLFRQRGYSIVEEDNKEIADLILKVNGEITYVQYRHWREYEINVAALEGFDSALESESIKCGIVVTTGLFSQEALDYSHGKHLLLINGVDLGQMIGVLSASDHEELIEEAEEEMPELEPLCPICSREMIKRTARKGKNAGNTFWGCSQYPNCLGVVSD